jgi:hypothetical protein
MTNVLYSPNIPEKKYIRIVVMDYLVIPDKVDDFS